GDTQLPGESPTGSFDLILGSEILYLKDQHLNLLRTIKAFSSPTTCTYLLYKHRNLSEIDFILLAREAGFKVKKVPTTTLDPEFQNDGYTLILLVLDSRTTNPQDCGST
ncbi:Methyltransferase-like protein 21B, partial [Spiromyces aspiralis]